MVALKLAYFPLHCAWISELQKFLIVKENHYPI